MIRKGKVELEGKMRGLALLELVCILVSFRPEGNLMLITYTWRENTCRGNSSTDYISVKDDSVCRILTSEQIKDKRK